MRASPRTAILAIAVFVGACGGSVGPSNAPTPAATPAPTGESLPSLAIPSPSPAASSGPATALPTTTPTPVAVVSPSPARTPAPTPAASARPTPRPTPKPTPKATPRLTATPTPVTLALTARDLAFAPGALTARAGAPFRIAFSNQDADVEHSVAIRNVGGASVFTGATVTGVKTATYSVKALPVGSYTFFCTIHPFMTGSLAVH